MISITTETIVHLIHGKNNRGFCYGKTKEVLQFCSKFVINSNINKYCLNCNIMKRLSAASFLMLFIKLERFSGIPIEIRVKLLKIYTVFLN